MIGVRATADMACGLEGLMDEATLEAYSGALLCRDRIRLTR